MPDISSPFGPPNVALQRRRSHDGAERRRLQAMLARIPTLLGCLQRLLATDVIMDSSILKGVLSLRLCWIARILPTFHIETIPPVASLCWPRNGCTTWPTRSTGKSQVGNSTTFFESVAAGALLNDRLTLHMAL